MNHLVLLFLAEKGIQFFGQQSQINQESPIITQNQVKGHFTPLKIVRDFNKNKGLPLEQWNNDTRA